MAKLTQTIQWRRLINPLVCLVFLCMLLPITAQPQLTLAADDPPKAHKGLLQWAKDHPDDTIRIIVQKDRTKADAQDDEPEQALKKGGGKLNRKLGLINGFSGEISGKELAKLAKNKKLKWVSLDAPLFSASLPGFGATGMVTTAVGSGNETVNGMAVQTDGKIVVAGSSNNGMDDDFALARYNTDGSLDTSFAGSGKLTKGFGFGNDVANSVAIQADGKILVAGTSYNGTAFLFTLLRYNNNGTLDTSFDFDGIVTTAVGTKKNDLGQSVTVQPDGKILVAGSSYNGSNYDFALARYNTNGSLDTSFAGSGKLTTAIGSSHDYGYSVAVQADGMILVAGTSYNGSKYNFALARYTTNGSLDKTFASSGKLTTAISTATDRAYSVAVQADGKILAAGESNFDFALVRYNTNGSLDTSFAGSGKVTTAIGASYDFGRSLAVQADGKILVAGYSNNGSNYDFALVRYTTSGGLDTSFSGSGKVTTAMGASNDYGFAVAVQPDGKILVAGSSNNGSNDDFAVARYNSDGGLDCSQCIDTGNLANVYDRAIGADRLWNAPDYLQGQGVTVAVVDSGINDNADFQVNTGTDSRIMTATTVISGSTDVSDGYGHGTFVAGIVAGSGKGDNGAREGVAPGAKLINVKVANANGMTYASDLVHGLQWINDNRAAYNIKVVNISLNSTVTETYRTSPLSTAVEMLWFNGVVVVVSAGNNGNAGGPVTLYPPANDPFVITVGATDDQATPAIADDQVSTFSAYGTTEDGYAKPDLVAPGRNIISLLAGTNSNVYLNHVANRVDTQVFRMSGTSMAAPMVSGAAALVLQDEPSLNPDQVKNRLLTMANKSWAGYVAAKAGAGYLDAFAAVHGATTLPGNLGLIPNDQLAKMALLAYWATNNGGNAIDWSTVNWNSVNWNSVNWNSVNWNSVNWNSVNWNSVNWNSVNWNSVNWNSVNWNSVNWNSVNWNSVNWNSVNWNSVNWSSDYWGQ